MEYQEWEERKKLEKEDKMNKDKLMKKDEREEKNKMSTSKVWLYGYDPKYTKSSHIKYMYLNMLETTFEGLL